LFSVLFFIHYFFCFCAFYFFAQLVDRVLRIFVFIRDSFYSGICKCGGSFVFDEDWRRWF
jgi:hypothetical protein